MSTRTAKDDSVFHQGRYASNPEFERGLLGNLVAKRAALLDRPEDRELLWAVHFLSHQPGGLAAVARDLQARYPELIGTSAMVQSGRPSAQNYSADEIRQIRLELPAELRCRFPLKGELKSKVRDLRTKYDRLASSAERARALLGLAENAFHNAASFEDIITGEREVKEKADREAAASHPAVYPVATLRELCRRAAADGMDLNGEKTKNLERELADMCLNPEWDFSAGGPWYFRSLTQTLRDYLAAWTAEKTKGVETKLGRIIADEFDYTWHGRCLSLLSGEARRGKSHAAKMCCLKNPGRARFVEVPPGNDDTSFFRALARGLGLGNFLKYKTIDIRERVESVLRSGDLLLILDESQRLWPERNFRYAYPSRIVWLMAMANAKIPILMVSTPQFLTGQKVAEKNGWNSSQLTGRIFNFKILPADLDEADLIAVCRSVLPEAGEPVLCALAEYARSSARYLAAVESIAQRARYLASRAGRSQCTNKDIRVAMEESIIPSDNLLNAALQPTRAGSSRRRLPAAPLLELLDESAMEPIAPSPARNTTPANPAPIRANITEFATA